MASSILVDLGPQWGQIVQLEVLENIIQIERTSDYLLRVTSEIPHETRPRTFKFTSASPFSEDEVVEQNARLMGFSNGIISLTDMKTIIKHMELQTGVEANVILDSPAYDLNFLRKMWATMHKEPYFRFVLHYDPVAGTVVVEESHNDAFLPVIPEWIGATRAILVPDPHDQIMLFAYESIFQLAEPLLPEDETGVLEDPLADIPVMGAGNRQQVDLARMRVDQISPIPRG